MIMKKRNKQLVSLFLIGILVFSLIPMAFAESTEQFPEQPTQRFSQSSQQFPKTSGSTSITNTQYFQPNVQNQYLSDYSSLYSGPSYSRRAGEDSEVYDLMVQIPPLGCDPKIVRSDLLEEQNVPVFCKLSSVSVNPGLDISRISRIKTTLVESNSYIAGIGFHPAQAAIRSRGRLISAPIDENLGYVVVVLKQQESESDMPDNVSAMLSAVLEYDAENTFGIGQTEFYLPILSDKEFENNHKEYGFWNGIGYLRAESIDERRAVISVYDSSFRKRHTSNLVIGKSSSDINIPTFTGGQGVKITLREITVPETKARIRVNGEEYEVYRNSRFSSAGCRLSNLESYGGTTGIARVSCKGKTFELRKDFGKVNLKLPGGAEKEVEVGDEISSGIYLAYRGNLPRITPEAELVQYSILINTKGVSLSDSELVLIRRHIAREIKSLGVNYNSERLQTIKAYKTYKYEFIFSDSDLSSSSGISFDKAKYIDAPFGDSKVSEEYYQHALTAYDFVSENYGTEALSETSYGQQALCQKFLLAKEFGQEAKKREVLLDLVEKYPSSSCGEKDVQSWLFEENVLSKIGSTYAHEDGSLYFELISVTEPSIDDASVTLTYEGITSATSGIKTLVKEESWNMEERNTKITLHDLSQQAATVSYSCDKINVQSRTNSGRKVVEEGSFLDLEGCGTRIRVDKINLRSVAKVQVTPKTSGRIRESNFSFNIGIEKRSKALRLTPEKALEKIKKINKTIKKWEDINADIGEVVTGLKGACLATSMALQIKTLFSGFDGTSAARTEVMRDIWNPRCSDSSYWVGGATTSGTSYSSAEECLLGEGAQIERDVEARRAEMKKINDNLKQNINTNLTRLGILTKTVPQDQSKAGYLNYLKTQYKGQIAGIENLGINDLSYEQLKELELSYKLSQSSTVSDYGQSVYKKTYDGLVEDISAAEEMRAERVRIANELGLSQDIITFLEDKDSVNAPYRPQKWADHKSKLQSKFDLPVGDDEYIQVVNYKSQDYLYILNKVGDRFVPDAIYSRTTSSGETNLLFSSGADGVNNLGSELSKLSNIKFIQSEQRSYHNRIKNYDDVGAKFFATQPYKGMPSLIPFDEENGWYVQVSQLMFGGQRYAESGIPLIYEICNVGEDGYIQVGGDKCQRFDVNQDVDCILGVCGAAARSLATKARNAIIEAKRQVSNNPSTQFITINGMRLKVSNVDSFTGARCTDFMSANDCKILFNVCDPVVCPNSRCDMGGRYRVDDVIQSGIVGSVTLCLPNAKEGVIIPVCLTGIHAGLEGWISILTAYRDCLQTNVDTGKTVGICDQVHSVYVCDFFWKQLGPYLNVLLQNAFSYLMGEGLHGGGEYMFVAKAFDNVENSVTYFTNTYASTSKLGFGVTSFAELGSEICKLQASATYPDGFDSILEPESPYQVNAWFSESTYTTATIPASSHYKVSYTIFAGNDQGVNYRVYLREPTTTLGTISKSEILVDSGYLPQGETLSESKDFTDVSGFKKLCVRINTKDHCGFKSVSTGFALNYLKDKVLEDELAQDVTTEKDCVSGNMHLGNILTNPNLQQGIEDTIDPQLYNKGVTRVCASSNPAQGTNQESRWKRVGHCGNENMGCWVDTQSVKDSLNGKGIEDQALKDTEQKAKELADGEGSYDLEEVTEKKIQKLINDFGWATERNEIEKKNLGDEKNKIRARIVRIEERTLFNHHKAEMYYFEAQFYDKIARTMYKNLNKEIEDVEEFFEFGYIIEFDGKFYDVIVAEGIMLVESDLTSEKINELISTELIEEVTEGVGDLEEPYTGYKIETNNEIVLVKQDEEIPTNLFVSGEVIKYGSEPGTAVGTITESIIAIPTYEITGISEDTKIFLRDLDMADINEDNSITIYA